MSLSHPQSQCIVYVGSPECTRLEDAHTERSFDSPEVAMAFLWGMAKAHKLYPVWMFQAGRGWITNRQLRPQKVPEHLREMANTFANRANYEASRVLYDTRPKAPALSVCAAAHA